MRLVLAGLLILHGIAHGVGFAVPWGLVEPEDESLAGTTVLWGRIDLGEAGIRAWGVVWLALGVAFVGAGLAALADHDAWVTAAVAVTAVSLVACLVSLPATRVGLAVNAVVLLWLWLGAGRGWF